MNGLHILGIQGQPAVWRLLLGVWLIWLGRGMVYADPDDLPDQEMEAFSPAGFVQGSLLPGEESQLRFGVVGDFGVSGPVVDAISQMILGWEPEFILSTGDNTYGPLDSNIDEDPVLPGFQNAWEFNVGQYYGSYLLGRTDGKFPTQNSPEQRFFPSVGNHDSAPDAGDGGTIVDYLDYFHENPGGAPRLPLDRGAVHNSEISYYALRRGVVDVFILDGDVPLRPDLIAQQKAWLVQQAEASDARWKIAVFHQPPITSGFRAGAAWMLWDELRQMDVILCGHDHFYERLDYFGVPLIITGAGGQFLYSFRDPPDARSLFRFNARHSAMRVTADSNSLRLECRTLALPAREEVAGEELVLGDPAPVDNEDLYSFFVEAGETILLTTATPGPPANPPLDLELLLFPPSGPAVEPDDRSSPDGRNEVLRYTASRTGHWKAALRATAPQRGSYALQLQLISPRPAYVAWSAPLPAGQQGFLDDPDGDAYNNLLEFALQTNPADALLRPEEPWQGLRVEHAGTNETFTVTFDLPSPLPPGLTYQVQGATSPEGPWSELAWRSPGSDWKSVAESGILTGGPLPGSRRVSLSLPADHPRRFFRIAVTAPL